MSVSTVLVKLATWALAEPERATMIVLGAITAAWKSVPAELRARFEVAHPKLVGVLRVVAKVAPDVIGALRAFIWQVLRGAPRAGSNPPPPPSASAGFTRTSVLRFVAAMAVLGLVPFVLARCRMPAPDGCTPLAVRCSPTGVPQVCDPEQRWTPSDDQCSSHDAVCCVTRSSRGRKIALCLPTIEVCNAPSNDNP